ncbi:MAG TPA: CBS domain-containing protein, partial [Candidatus Binatus sp.]|nr:CBS domain-containing protein [Candidatus Binatus sp.]
MTVPVAAAVLAVSLGVLLALIAPYEPRLLRHGSTPARPRRFWVTLLVVREVATATAAAAAAWIALAESGPVPPWAAAALAGAGGYLVVELLAPAVGLALPDAWADRVSDVASRVISVLRRPLERPAVTIAGWLAGEPGLAPVSLLRFSADGTVDEGEEAALDERGRELLGRVRALRQRSVRAVMTPRVRVVALPVDIGGPALLATLRDQRFSRIPVYRGERDNVVGVLYAKDLLGRDVSAPGFRLEPFLRPPLFVPLGMRAGEVFQDLRRRKVHLALVVDEYGGIAGLVTMEDLLEELFGE